MFSDGFSLESSLPPLFVGLTPLSFPFSFSQSVKFKSSSDAVNQMKHKRGKGDPFEEQRPPIRLPCSFLTKRAPYIVSIVVHMACT